MVTIYVVNDTTVSYAVFITIGAWPVVGLSLLIARIHTFLMYFVLDSWGAKDSLTIISICLYALCYRSIATATADPHYTKQYKTVKSPFTCDVPKNTVLGVGSHVKYSTQLHLTLYLSLDPTPHTVFFVHHL